MNEIATPAHMNYSGLLLKTPTKESYSMSEPTPTYNPRVIARGAYSRYVTKEMINDFLGDTDFMERFRELTPRDGITPGEWLAISTVLVQNGELFTDSTKVKIVKEAARLALASSDNSRGDL